MFSAVFFCVCELSGNPLNCRKNYTIACSNHKVWKTIKRVANFRPWSLRAVPRGSWLRSALISAWCVVMIRTKGAKEQKISALSISFMFLIINIFKFSSIIMTRFRSSFYSVNPCCGVIKEVFKEMPIHNKEFVLHSSIPIKTPSQTQNNSKIIIYDWPP